MLRQEIRNKETSGRGAVFNNPGKKIRMIRTKQHKTGAKSVSGNHSNVFSAS